MNYLDYSRIHRVWLAAGYTDMRKGIDGLATVVQSQLKLDPFDQSLFLFCGRKTTMIKGLLWEGDGFILVTKRLVNGKFQWPRTPAEALELNDQQLRWLLEGLSIYQKKAILPARTNRVL